MAKRKKSVRAVAKKSAAKKPAKKAVARKTPKRGHLRSVAPGLTVNDAEKSIAWYRDVLGFTVGQRWENDGKLMGAEMRAGDVTFNLGQDDWKMGRDRVKGVGMRMYITTGPSIDRPGAHPGGGGAADRPADR